MPARLLSPLAPLEGDVTSVAVLGEPSSRLRREVGRVAVGPGGVWVLDASVDGELGRMHRVRQRRRIDRVRSALAESAYARTPVAAFVSLPQTGLAPHLLPDGSLAAGPDRTLEVLAAGALHDGLDVLAICEVLDRVLGG